MGLGGCGEQQVPGGADPGSAPTSTSAPAPVDELPPGWDESPDGPPPEPDDALDDDELRALLRTRASAAATPAHCRADDVQGSLVGSDAAAGHRYSTIVLTNVSGRGCVVEGMPGIGVRGTWGQAFRVDVSPVTGAAKGEPVTIGPRESASAPLEWSGALAGAEQERASILVVQLAKDQAPLRVPAAVTGSADQVDIGMESAVGIGPFERAH